MKAKNRHPLLLLLLLALVFFPHFIHAQPQQEPYNEYILYSLKPFSVQITSSSIDENTDLNVASLGLTMKAVTETFLKQDFDAALLHDSSPIHGQVEGVSLQVSVKRSSQRKRRLSGGITAELVGGVAFEHVSSLPDRDAMEAHLQTLLESAFSPPSLGIYQERLMATDEPHLQHLTSMIVTPDFENPSSRPTVGHGTPTSSNQGEKNHTIKVTFTTILSILLVGFVGVLFVRMRRASKRTFIDNEGTSRSPTHQDFIGSHQHNLACMAEQGHPYHVSIQRQHYPGKDQDDYPPESPSVLSRFYQATFAGSQATEDTTSDASSFGTGHAIHNPRVYDVRLNEEEEDIVDHHIHRSGPYIEQQGGTLASWVKSISAPFSKNTQQQEEELQFMRDPNSQKPFVYRDFPRHDGTPCLIYNSPAVRERKSLNGSTVWATSSLSPTSTSHEEVEQDEEEEEEPVDSFVDRLEQLMVVRHEQYQERRNMEWQRKRKSTSSVISIQEAEAALDDFLDISTGENISGKKQTTTSRGGGVVPLVSPTDSDGGGGLHTTPPKMTRSLEYENCLTDEKNIDEAMRAQYRVSWDEEDPTMRENEIC